MLTAAETYVIFMRI